MQKTNYRILTIFILSTFLWLGCDSEWNKKGDNGSRWSRTIEESKQNEAFEFEMIPYRSHLTLDSGLKLQVVEAWVENVWFRQHRIFGKTPTEKSDMNQFILNFNIIQSAQKRTNHWYYFVANKHLDKSTDDIMPYDLDIVHFFCDGTDTIRVPLYREKTNSLPSKKQKSL